MANKIKDSAKQKVREDISNAYAAIKGREQTQSAQAFTYEEALDQQIKAIEGKDTPLRPNALTRISKIEANLRATVETLRGWPEDAFLKPEGGEHYVNTPEEDV